MHYYQKFALIGLIIGIFPIILGIIALTTPAWISINHGQSSNRTSYGLFPQCTTNETSNCEDIDSFQTSQYLEIIGYVILIVGLLAGVLCTALIDKHSIHFIAPLILIIGTVTILLGFMFYIKSVVENSPPSSDMKLHLGYSMILMIATCIIGYILTAYFSFSAGYIHRHILATVNIY
jgi:small-conductance mechanosensitive channel